MRGYFHTDSDRDMEWLENVLRTARERGNSVRLHTEDGRLKVKVGGGMWTAPLSGTFDQFRDDALPWEVAPNVVQTPRLSVGPDGKPVVSE